MKQIHRYSIGAVVIALVLTGAFVAAADEGGPEDVDSYIEVSASGEASAEPDRAVVSLEVEARDDDVEAARDEAARRADSVTDALDGLGLQDSYETTGFDVGQTRPIYAERGEEMEEPEFVASHSYQVTLDDPDRAGEVIDEAIDAGATEVDGVSMTLSESERERVKDRAIEDAMDEARSQADTLAAAGALDVVGVRNVESGGAGVSPVRGNYMMEMAEADDALDDAPPTEIEHDDVEVSASVQVVYDVR